MKYGRLFSTLLSGLILASTAAPLVQARDLPVSSREPEKEVAGDSPLIFDRVPEGLVAQSQVTKNFPELQNLLRTYMMRTLAPRILGECISDSAACALKTQELEWAKSLYHQMDSNSLFAPILFAFPDGRFYPTQSVEQIRGLETSLGLDLKPGLFDHNSPEPSRFAISTLVPGGIIFNLGQMDPARNPGRDLDDFTLLGMVFHELVHQLGVQDDLFRLPDIFGSKLADFARRKHRDFPHYQKEFSNISVMLDSHGQGPMPVSGQPYAGVKIGMQESTVITLSDGATRLTIQDAVAQTLPPLEDATEYRGMWLSNPKWEAPVWSDSSHLSGSIGLELAVTYIMARPELLSATPGQSEARKALFINGNVTLAIPIAQTEGSETLRFAPLPFRIQTDGLNLFSMDDTIPQKLLESVQGNFAPVVQDGSMLGGTLDLELPVGSVPEALTLRAESVEFSRHPILPTLYLFLKAHRIQQLDESHYRFYFADPVPKDFVAKQFSYAQAYLAIQDQKSVLEIPFARPFHQRYDGPKPSNTIHLVRSDVEIQTQGRTSAWEAKAWIDSQSGTLSAHLNFEFPEAYLPFLMILFEVQSELGNFYYLCPGMPEPNFIFNFQSDQVYRYGKIDYSLKFDLSRIPNGGKSVRPVAVKVMNSQGEEATFAL